MKIDIFNHIYPKKFYDKYIDAGQAAKTSASAFRTSKRSWMSIRDSESWMSSAITFRLLRFRCRRWKFLPGPISLQNSREKGMMDLPNS